jgi:hypothetical protein
MTASRERLDTVVALFPDWHLRADVVLRAFGELLEGAAGRASRIPGTQ